MLFRLPSGVIALMLSLAHPGLSADISPVSTGERDIVLVPNGAVADAGWALARLNDCSAPENGSFLYPETSNPVRLYLIDTALAHTATWFTQNPKLTVEHSEVIQGSSHPPAPGDADHGTQMLSLIAGPETGAALGTPIRLVHFNIYPQGRTAGTTSGRVIDAVAEAIAYHDAHPGLPGVICLASGSLSGAESAGLHAVIEEAIEAGITVVVSAGNEGDDALDYIPSAYGIQPGIICVGASDADNQHLPSSNSGPAVDLYAPGHNVRTLALPQPQSGSYGSMTGTSPAAALVTAAAIIELSQNPALTPAEVEAALTQCAAPSVSVAGEESTAELVQVEPDPEGDSDGDGTSDLLEQFFGSNPADASDSPAALGFSRSPGQVQLGFAVSAGLFDPANPYVLSNGATWKVRWSENLSEWQDAVGTLTPGTTDDGKIGLSFQMPTNLPACFLRIEVTPAP